VLVSLAAAFLLLTVYGWFIPEPGPNELSRVDLTFALVQQHSTSIDAYHDNTIDRAFAGGHYYSDKPPGLPLLAAPALFVLDRALRLGDMGEVRVSYVAHLLTDVAVALPAALLAPLVALTAARLGARPAGAVLSAAAMALGTALLPFATTFYAHDTSAALGFAAFAFASRALLPERPLVGMALAGVCAGLAALVEHPVILVGAAVFVWLLARRESGRGVAAYLLGGFVALLPLPLYDWVSFGAPWRLGYGFVDQAAFPGQAAGLFGVTSPRVDALAEVTVGPAGLLAQSPWLALGVLGFALLARRGGRGAALTAAAVVALFLLYNSSYYLPMGGQSSGPRFLIPALPFLALGLAFLPALAWPVVGPLAAYSAAQMLAIAAVEPKPGPGLPNPFWSYWLPRLGAGDVAESWGELRWGLRGVGALAPLALPAALALGAVGLASARRLRRGLGGPAALCAAAVATWAILALPFGSAGVPPLFRLRVDAPPQRTIGVVYRDQIELVGYEMPDAARPGDWLDLVLYWRALGPEPDNLTGVVHAVGRDGANLAGYDGPPVGAGFPTNMWRPGELLRTTYRLRLDDRAAAPSALGIVVGLRGPGNQGMLPARDAGRAPLAAGAPVARAALRGPTIAAPEPPRAQLEGGVELVGWRTPPPTAAGATARGLLTWRARTRPERDATVFVQALGPNGPIAQWDSQPVGGAYPTSLWPAGEVVEDAFALTIPAATPPGDYPLIAGMYLLPQVKRLAVVGGGDHVDIGRLTVTR